MSDKTIKANKLNVDLPMTIISVALLFGFVLFMVIEPEKTLNGVTSAFNLTTQVFGTSLMIFTFVTFLLAVYLAFSKYGKIKLGDCDPEYSTFSYIAMMALAALASAALFWSFTEWAYYYAKPGLGMEAYSVEAAEISLGYAFFHWGFATQAPYVLSGVAIAYAVYNRKVKFMKVSSVCEEMMGNFKYKKILGKIIDISVIFCIVGALGCTLGLAVPLASGALSQVFGIESTFVVQVLIVVAIASIFTMTSFIGTKKGMKNLSNFSAALCIAFLLFVLIAGPTIFILKNFVSSMGWMIDKYVSMSFFTDPVAQTGFTEEWTLFFQAFCLTYTALMGIFVAKISKGRTIKQVSLCCLLGVSAGVWALFGIDGGFALHSEVTGAVNVSEIVMTSTGQDSIYQVIEQLPGGTQILPIIVLIIIVGFVASSLDTASFSLSQTTTLALDKDGNVNKWLRVFWCIILTLIPLSIMFANADFSALKSLAILVSIPFMFVVIFMEIVLFRWLKEDVKKQESALNAKLDKLDRLEELGYLENK